MRSRSSVVIIEGNHVLLIKRVKNNELYYVYPGGGIEAGETPEDAAIREAFEELGIQVKLIGMIEAIQYDGMQYFFHAEIVSGTIGTGEGEEYSDPERGSYEPMFVPIDKLDSLPVYPKEMAEKIVVMGEKLSGEMENDSK